MFSRAVRFASSLAIATLCFRVFGVERWGTAVIVLALVELLGALDFGTPELCAVEAARAETPDVLMARLGQALWLLLVPALIGVVVLCTSAELAGTHLFRTQQAHAETLSALSLASACAHPVLLLANAYGAALQGIGRLRELNAVQVWSGLLELSLVIGAVALGGSLITVQWLRALSQGARCALFALSFVRLGLPVPCLRRPHARTLRSMARAALGFGTTKMLGAAIYKINVPVAQAFTTASVLAAYDAVDRLGTVLQRAANPVWDSLFSRLVRGFAPAASASERALARRDFSAGTLLLNALAALATMSTLNLAPWLFPLWLGPAVAQEPTTFAPWVLATWSLNLGASMCTAALLAGARLGRCNLAHVIALAIDVAALSWMGGHDGRLALLAAPLVGNAVLAALLGLAGCRVAGVPPSALFARVLVVWCPALLAVGIARLLSSPLWVGAVTLVGAAGVVRALRGIDDVRAFARAFSDGDVA